MGDEHELEGELLARDHPRITLALARYGTSRPIVEAIFQRRDDPAFRLGVLSNSTFARNSFRFPGDLAEGGMSDFTDQELVALFENPGLDHSFVTHFLEQGETWTSITDEQRRLCLFALAQRLKGRGAYDGRWDGYAEYSFNKVYDVAWRLADLVPVNKAWAYALGSLYHVLPPKAFSIKDPLSMVARWSVADGSPDYIDELKSNKRGSLSPFQHVRAELGRLAVAGDYENRRREAIRTSEDIALRCAGYRDLPMDEAQMEAAYEQDGEVAVEFMMQNEAIWKMAALRDTLRDFAWRCAKKDENSSLLTPERVSRKWDQLEAENPEWFRDVDVSPDDPEHEPNRTELMRTAMSRIERQLASSKLLVWLTFAAAAIAAFQS